MINKSTKVVHLISSFRRGGRERQLATLVKYLREDNVKPKLICFNYSKESYVEEYDLDVTYLKAKKPFARLIELIKILRKEKYDILWTWGGFEASYGLIASVFSSTKHINGSVRHGILSPKISQYWRTLILHLSKYRVANSRAGLNANFLKRGFVWYNGIDKKFKEKTYISSSELITFISVANLVPYKDYFTTLDALSKLKHNGIKYRYWVIGGGPMKDEIQTYITKLGLEDEVSLLGKISNVNEYLPKADIFIHSSRGEGCSNAILEAMFSGLPIIASATGGTPEIVTPENGLLFEYQNKEQLFQQLEKLVKDKNLREKMGKKSIEVGKNNFSTEKMKQTYFDIINEVIQ